MRRQVAFLVARLADWFIHAFSLGSGSTWPGHIALKIDPHIVAGMLRQSDCQVVLVAGTNGKSTTASMIRTMLRVNGVRLMYNEEGANLLNGIASTIIRAASWRGEIGARVAVFEVDENALTALAAETKPSVIVLLNLFRDQLDRYGEVNTIVASWKKMLADHPAATVIVNANDPLINSLAHKRSHTIRFGAAHSLMRRRHLGHDVDSTFCPLCRHALTFDAIAYSHVGQYHCPKCGFATGSVLTYEKERFAAYPLLGLYNVYNTHAALATAAHLTSLSPKVLHADLMQHFTPMFGRQEVVRYRGRRIMLILSKNPAGFNQSLATLTEAAREGGVGVLMLLNDQIPDGRDVSWIWDTDMSGIGDIDTVVVGGDRAYDMALRVSYEQAAPQKPKRKSKGYVLGKGMFASKDLESALDYLVDHSPEHAQLFILPTYSAMLAVRRFVVGSKFDPQSS